MEVWIRASNRCKVILNAWQIEIKNRCPAGTSVLSFRSFDFTPYGVSLRMTTVGRLQPCLYCKNEGDDFAKRAFVGRRPRPCERVKPSP